MMLTVSNSLILTFFKNNSHKTNFIFFFCVVCIKVSCFIFFMPDWVVLIMNLQLIHTHKYKQILFLLNTFSALEAMRKKFGRRIDNSSKNLFVFVFTYSWLSISILNGDDDKNVEFMAECKHCCVCLSYLILFRQIGNKLKLCIKIAASEEECWKHIRHVFAICFLSHSLQTHTHTHSVMSCRH
jgi:hypothetical protein